MSKSPNKIGEKIKGFFEKLIFSYEDEEIIQDKETQNTPSQLVQSSHIDEHSLNQAPQIEQRDSVIDVFSHLRESGQVMNDDKFTRSLEIHKFDDEIKDQVDEKVEESVNRILSLDSGLEHQSSEDSSVIPQNQVEFISEENSSSEAINLDEPENEEGWEDQRNRLLRGYMMMKEEYEEKDDATSLIPKISDEDGDEVVEESLELRPTDEVEIYRDPVLEISPYAELNRESLEIPVIEEKKDDEQVIHEETDEDQDSENEKAIQNLNTNESTNISEEISNEEEVVSDELQVEDAKEQYKFNKSYGTEYKDKPITPAKKTPWFVSFLKFALVISVIVVGGTVINFSNIKFLKNDQSKNQTPQVAEQTNGNSSDQTNINVEVKGASTNREEQFNEIVKKRIISSEGGESKGVEKILDESVTSGWKVYTNQSQSDKDAQNTKLIIDLDEPYFIQKLRVKIGWEPDAFYKNEFGDSAILRMTYSSDYSKWIGMEDKVVKRDDMNNYVVFAAKENVIARYVQLEWVGGKRGNEDVWNGSGYIYDLNADGNPLVCKIGGGQQDQCSFLTYEVFNQDKRWKYDFNESKWSSTELSQIPYFEEICRKKPRTEKDSTCTIDTVTTYKSGNQAIQSITAYGEYWDYAFDNNSSEASYKLISSGSLNSIERYNNGPCSSDSSCKFDTRTIYKKDGTLVEEITVAGEEWIFRYNDKAKSWEGGKDSRLNISSVERYKNGPCRYSQDESECRFESRSVYNYASTVVEYIVAYDRYFIFALNNSELIWNSSGDSASSVLSTNNGPCQGLSGTCVFDSLNLANLSNISLWSGEGVTAGWSTIVDGKAKTYLVNGSNLWINTSGNWEVMSMSEIIDPMSRKTKINNIDAAWASKDGKTFMIVQGSKYMLMNPDMDELKAWGDLSSISYWKDVPAIESSGNKVFPWTDGITSGWINQSDGTLTVISGDKYWMQGDDSSWGSTGLLSESLQWQNAPYVDGMLPWSGNGISAVIPMDNDFILIVNGNRYWIKNAKSSIWTESGYLKDYKEWQNSPKVLSLEGWE